MTRRRAAFAEHPFELLFGLIAVLGGSAAALGIVSPTSINAVLPLPVVRAWGALQLLAGALVLVGILISYGRPRATVLGWRIERAGLWPLAATLIVYGVVALAYSGMRALYPVAFYLAFAAACIARARAVARLEQAVRAAGRRDGR